MLDGVETVDPPGVSRRYGGKSLDAVKTDPVQMPKLRADLRAMGFELVPAAGDKFDEPLRAAVREFQTHAGRTKVAKGPLASPSPATVPDDLVYDGPISGVPDNATWAAIDMWR
jgi:hypothetical protein